MSTIVTPIESKIGLKAEFERVTRFRSSSCCRSFGFAARLRMDWALTLRSGSAVFSKLSEVEIPSTGR